MYDIILINVMKEVIGMKAKIDVWKQEWFAQKDIFFSALLVGLLTHGYMMFNKLPNIDEYVAMFHYGSGYSSGRWLLALMGNFMFRIDGVYSLPYLNGAFFLFTLAISITVFLKPFDINNRWIKRIFAALFVAFPTVTSTMSFMFTVPFYGIAILFMALAFYLAVTYKYGFLPSILLVCCSLGIYQAYWCLGASFFLLYLISLCMNKDTKNKELLTASLKILVTLLAGLVLYLVINKIMLAAQNMNLSGYQGINQMGAFSLSQLPTILYNAYGWFFRMVTENYLYITWYPIVRYIIGIGYLLTIVCFSVACFQNRKHILRLLGLILFTLILPLTINSIYLMCNDASTIHLLMCYSVVLVFFMPLVYLQGVCATKALTSRILPLFKGGYLTGLLLVLFLYVRLANLYYLDLELAYNETNSFMITLSTRIQQTEGYTTDKPLYFHGLYPHATNRNIWELRAVNQMHGTIDVDNMINSPLMRYNFSRVYLSTPIHEVTDPAIIEELQDDIQEMSNYPNDGSIKLIDDVIVIKLSD